MSVGLTVYEVRDVIVLDISGRLSILDENLRNCIREHLEDGHRHFILKMDAVTYIDSCGLGELITVYTTVVSSGGTMRLLMPSDRVRELLKVTRLDTVFDTIEDTGPFAQQNKAAGN